MSTAILTTKSQGILRYSKWDALLITLAAAHGVLLMALPTASVIALAFWWNANTISHYFIHKPFFRARMLNRLFSLYLSLVLGIPQSLWRDRHLAHHAATPWRARLTRQLLLEVGVLLAWWGLLLALRLDFALRVYLPGVLAGLGLCWVHGHYEHAAGTTSHYGKMYNLLFFNDGYHSEHHAQPGKHWTALPERPFPGAHISRWPAVLRWLEAFSLDNLERCVLRSPALRQFVLRRHERAFRVLLEELPAPRRIGIVGGGLFPRTLLILRRLVPEAQLVVIDRSEASIATARAFVPADIQFIAATYEPARVRNLDLLVFPLAYIGDREALYRVPAAPAVLVHDWIWRRRGASVVISALLLKRLNLVRA